MATVLDVPSGMAVVMDWLTLGSNTITLAA